MIKWLMLFGVAAASYCLGGGIANANPLLNVGGHMFKWGAASAGTGAFISYAVLQTPYTVPRSKSTLSPDNCGAMHPFADIIAQSPRVTIDLARSELQAAFATWSEVADVIFVEVTDLNLANIIIGASSKQDGRAFANLSFRGGDGTGAIAKALGTVSANVTASVDQAGELAVIEQAYICLSPAFGWKTGFDGRLGVYDLRYTFAHEIGHAIGLDHPGSAGALMAYRYDERVSRLQPSDINAVRFLYGHRK